MLAADETGEALDDPASDLTPVRPTTRRGWAVVLAILGLALLLRVGAVLATHHYAPLTDAMDFDRIASSIASGHGYGNAVIPPAHGPSAFRAPGYPFALSLVYAVFGNHHWTLGRLENAAIGTVLVGLIGLIAAQLFSRRVAVFTMALAAVHPAMILTSTGLQLEPLLAVLMMGAVAAALQHRRQPRGMRWPLLAGLLIGLAALTRETGFVLIPPVVWLVWSGGRPAAPRFGRAALAAPVAVVAVAMAMVAPWTIRNAVRLHAFEPVTTSSGFGLAGTYNETAVHDKKNPARWLTPYDDPVDYRILATMRDPTEVKVDRVMRQASIDVVRAHPTFPLVVAFWNTERLFDFDRGHYELYTARYVPYSLTLTRLAVYFAYVVLVLALIGAFFRAARRVPRAIWAIPVLMYVFMVFFLPANIRYRATLEPFFVLLASLPITGAAERWLPLPALAGEADQAQPDRGAQPSLDRS